MKLSTPYLLLASMLPLAMGRSLFEPDMLSSRSTPVKRAPTGYICENVAVDVPLNNPVCVTTPATTIPAVTTCTTGTPRTCTGSGLTEVCVPAVAPVCTITTPAVDVPASTTCTPGILNVRITDGVCLCITAGVLSQDSATRLNATVKGSGTLGQLLSTQQDGTVTYTLDSLLNFVAAQEQGILNTDSAAPGGCTYPTGSTPNSCSGDCGYTCPDGQSDCNGVCARTCFSGVPGFRRSFDEGSSASNFRCPTGHTACDLPLSRLDPNSRAFECVNIQSDIESCGGCPSPLSSSAKKGEDCTAIPNVLGVGCNQGVCSVLSCIRGFEVGADGKSCEAKATYWGQSVFDRKSRKDKKSNREVLRSR